VAWPFAAPAQQPERMRRVGFLLGATEQEKSTTDRINVFREGLAKLGWSSNATCTSTCASPAERPGASVPVRSSS
jgi:hypothetical protein